MINGIGQMYRNDPACTRMLLEASPSSLDTLWYSMEYDQHGDVECKRQALHANVICTDMS